MHVEEGVGVEDAAPARSPFFPSPAPSQDYATSPHPLASNHPPARPPACHLTNGMYLLC